MGGSDNFPRATTWKIGKVSLGKFGSPSTTHSFQTDFTQRVHYVPGCFIIPMPKKHGQTCRSPKERRIGGPGAFHSPSDQHHAGLLAMCKSGPEQVPADSAASRHGCLQFVSSSCTGLLTSCSKGYVQTESAPGSCRKAGRPRQCCCCVFVSP